MLSGIILASGFSRRFASDKLTYRVLGMPLVEHVVKNCLDSKLDEVIVVYRKIQINEYLKNYNIKCIKNENAEEGMSASLRLGIENTDPKSDGYMILMGDQILFDSNDINRMIEEYEIHEKIIAATYKGKRRTPVIFPSSYYDRLMKIKGDEGGRSILKDSGNDTIYIEYDSIKSIDIDRMEDVDKVLEYLEE
ncbi:molybdenum cofactor cytidylyltransferase [Dethiosulfatibacter aminovorans DSM 17477]|uniref:Molybdenum cofactor cytidylyltransferase n=1 Tax=Dethiosulfatibacter aminovorans DSM 17477 TaxID=1121476 RepID=A0A1M6G2L1_9FIRM|nr:nucleotidyltransferase family protein [Dethiosulfatibacter aminovorans]SHJ04122.1 molybdenum cofactor cytidylyltransferase [Dethiosulfatibacter aminovorans DSM 17477]